MGAPRDNGPYRPGTGVDLMAPGSEQSLLNDPRVREAAVTIPVYGQLPFVPERASGCDIFTQDGRRILDLYGGHAVAALGYGHPRLVKAIQEQSGKLACKCFCRGHTDFRSGLHRDVPVRDTHGL